MPAFEFSSVIFCDDIRKEVTNKDILIGVYTGDILVGSFPAWINLSIWAEIFASEKGVEKFDLRLMVGDREPLLFKASMEFHQSGGAAFAIPGMQIHFEKEGDLALEIKEGDQWRELKRKKVLQGSIKSPFPILPSPPGSLPSDS
jgi:hypothetical protein